MAVQGIARFLYVAAIGRALGGLELAHANTALTLAVTLALLWPTPLANAASRWLSLSDSDAAKSSLNRSALLSVVLTGVIAIPAAFLLGMPAGFIVSIVLAVIGYGLYAYARGARLGVGGALRVLVMDVISAVVALSGLAVVLVFGQPPLLLVPISLGYLVFAAVCMPWQRVRTRMTADAWRAVRRFTMWNVVGGAASNGLLLATMLIAYAVLESNEVGYFAAAFSLATPASMLGQALSQVLIPRMASDAGEAPLRSQAAVRLFAVFGAATFVAFGVAILLAAVILQIVYGGQFEAKATGTLQVMLLGVYLFTLSLVPAALLLARGRARTMTFAASVGFVAGLTATVAFAPAFGAAGVAWGFVAGSGLGLVAVIAAAVARPRAK